LSFIIISYCHYYLGGVEEFMALPKASTIVCYDDSGNLPRSVIDAIATKLRPVILQELSGLKSQVGTLKEESVNYAALADLFTPESNEENENANNKRNTVVPNKERDLARRKMMTFIQTTITDDRNAYLEEKRIKEDESRYVTAGALLHMTGQSNANLLATTGQGSRKGSDFSPGGASTNKRPTPVLINSGVPRAGSADQSNTTTTTTIVKADTTHIDEQLALLASSLESLQNQYEASKHTNNTEMSLLQSKLEQLEQANHVMMEKEGELREQRKKDTEQLKIMQKRLATVSVDNVSIAMMEFCLFLFFCVMLREKNCKIPSTYVSYSSFFTLHHCFILKITHCPFVFHFHLGIGRVEVVAVASE